MPVVVSSCNIWTEAPRGIVVNRIWVIAAPSKSKTIKYLQLAQSVSINYHFNIEMRLQRTVRPSTGVRGDKREAQKGREWEQTLLQWMDIHYAFFFFFLSCYFLPKPKVCHPLIKIAECLMVNAAAGIMSSTAFCLCHFSS